MDCGVWMGNDSLRDFFWLTKCIFLASACAAIFVTNQTVTGTSLSRETGQPGLVEGPEKHKSTDFRIHVMSSQRAHAHESRLASTRLPRLAIFVTRHNLADEVSRQLLCRPGPICALILKNVTVPLSSGLAKQPGSLTSQLDACLNSLISTRVV
jgi:hypothetical protein